MLPGSFRGKANGVIRYDHPNSGLNHRNRHLKKKSGEGESPRRAKQKVPVLVKHRQPLYGEGERGKAVEHVGHQGEEERADEDGAIGFVVRMHVRPEENCRCDDCYDDDLDGLEDVEEGIALHQQPFFVERRLQEL
ncbi:hypothetical protein U1Q18_006546 [Sarracenia purpurea var. burkii]